METYFYLTLYLKRKQILYIHQLLEHKEHKINMSTSSSVTQKNLDTNAEALKKEDKVLSEFDIQDERPKSLLWESAFVGVLCSAQLMTQAGLGQ